MDGFGELGADDADSRTASLTTSDSTANRVQPKRAAAEVCRSNLRRLVENNEFYLVYLCKYVLLMFR